MANDITKTLKCAIYSRVSTEDQAREGTSLETQRECLVKYAKERGWEIYFPANNKIYEDDGYSGYSIDRPALKRLLADAKLKKFQAVLVYKIDRFARNNRILLNLIEEFSSAEIGFISATESFDTVSASGKMALSMLGTVAQFERDRIIERVWPGMVKGVERGNWQGARYVPYGYLYAKEKKLLIVVPEEAEIVKMIYTMYLAEQSTKQIAGYLYKKGYKTRSGGRFQSKLVCDILKNQLYLGKIVWNKSHYEKTQKTLHGLKYIKNDPSKVIIAQGRHEPIICQEDFDAVQRRLEHSRKGGIRKMNSREYVLTGVLYCAKCGNRFQGCVSPATRRKDVVPLMRRYYRCSARQTYYLKCDNGYARADVIELEVNRLLEFMFADKDVSEARLLKLVAGNSRNYDENLEAEVTGLKEKLKSNLQKQERLSGIYTDGLLALEAYRNQIVPLREEEETFRADLKRLELKLVQRERSQDYQKVLQAVISHLEMLKGESDLIAKKGLLRLVFKSISIDNGRIKNFELYEPFKSLYFGEGIKDEQFSELFAVEEDTCVSTLSHTDAR